MIELFPVAGLSSGALAIALRPRGADWLEDELRGLKASGYSVLVSALEPSEAAELNLEHEARLAHVHGLEFIGSPIPDRSTPDIAAARILAERLSRALDEGKHVAVHCRQGIGRSALIVASVLVAGGTLPSSAWEKVAAARKRPVPDTEQQRAWLDSFAAHLSSRQQ
jgi:protein-tyrosine phosphatase